MCYIDSTDASGKVVLYSLQTNGCYTRPDLRHLEVYYSYADSGIAKFAVQALGDTIEHLDSVRNSTPIAVVAQSTSNREIQIDNSLLLNLTIDSVALAKFISPSGDTVSSPLNGVRYDDARGGKLKLVASRSPRDSVAKIGVSATLVSDPSKTGEGALYIVRSKARLRFIDKNPRQLWPYLESKAKGSSLSGYKSTRSFVIEALNGSGSPLANQYVNIQTSFKAFSGGHDHSTSQDSIMPWDLQGKFWSQGKSGNPLLGQLKTGADGRLTVDSLRSSTFSGTFVVWAWLAADTTVYDSVEIKVQIDSIVEFTIGSFDTLTGVPGENNCGLNHPSNHWCSQKTKDTLNYVLQKFYQWTSSQDGGGTPIRVGVNDMSLTLGGDFDIDGGWATRKRHEFHRVGLSADIDKGAMAKWQIDQLETMMNKKGAKRNSERPPIHFGFSGGQ